MGWLLQGAAKQSPDPPVSPPTSNICSSQADWAISQLWGRGSDLRYTLNSLHLLRAGTPSRARHFARVRFSSAEGPTPAVAWTLLLSSPPPHATQEKPEGAVVLADPRSPPPQDPGQVTLPAPAGTTTAFKGRSPQGQPAGWAHGLSLAFLPGHLLPFRASTALPLSPGWPPSRIRTLLSSACPALPCLGRSWSPCFVWHLMNVGQVCSCPEAHGAWLLWGLLPEPWHSLTPGGPTPHPCKPWLFPSLQDWNVAGWWPNSREMVEDTSGSVIIE